MVLMLLVRDAWWARWRAAVRMRSGIRWHGRWFALALGLDAVWSFWIAYVLTRPLGASIGDYLSQPTGDGGLGLGTVVTSALFLAVILGLVVYLSATRKDVSEPERTARHAA